MKRKRLFLKSKTNRKERIEIIRWAAGNGYDAVVFSLNENIKSEYIKLANHYGLKIEAGGSELSLLVPRKLFVFHRGLFRMEQGKRKKDHHFCPTNHRSTACIAEHAQKLFARSMQIVSIPRVFHLLPDEGFEDVWCSCPACRAFSPAEQNIIAVNSAADILAKLDPDARLSFLDFGNEPPEKAGVAPRNNMFGFKS